MNIPGAVVQHFLSTDPDDKQVDALRRLQLLVDDRIFGFAVPEGAKQRSILRNAIIVTPSGGGSLGPGARSYAPWRVNRLDIFCCGKTPADAAHVHGIVEEIMTGMEQTVICVADTVLKSAVISGGPLPGWIPQASNSTGPDWPYMLGIYEVHAIPYS